MQDTHPSTPVLVLALSEHGHPARLSSPLMTVKTPGKIQRQLPEGSKKASKSRVTGERGKNVNNDNCMANEAFPSIPSAASKSGRSLELCMGVGWGVNIPGRPALRAGDPETRPCVHKNVKRIFFFYFAASEPSPHVSSTIKLHSHDIETAQAPRPQQKIHSFGQRNRE